ncbi:MAG: tetratricopeptide repeat protein [Candidatus Bathyarchaeales archaeon]
MFFDDLERYLGAFDLADFAANFYKVAERIIVVATCHKEVFNAICEKPEFTRFFSKEDTLELCEYSNDEGKRIAAGLNKPFPEDFTGTVDQLVLDTLRKRQNYEENLDDNEKAILKSAKLLRTCYISAYSAQLLKAVWKQIFDGKGDWDGYFSKIVESYSMLRILPSSGVEKYSIADAYLDDKKGVICEYPSCKTEIVDDARLLKEILFEMKAIDELFAVGYFLANQGLYEDALAYFECVLKLKNDNYASWFNKGVALGKLGRYEEALAAFSKAIELKPNDYNAWYNKGLALGKLERHEEALTAFSKATELNPNNHDAWYNKGVALEKLGRHEEALRAFEKAMELDSNIISLAKVAQLLLILGDYTKGLNMAEKAFAISKTTEEKALSCLIKVSAYYLLNKIKEAEEEKSIMINLSTQGEKIKTPWDFSELLLAIEKLDNEKKKAILDLISYFTQK